MKMEDGKEMEEGKGEMEEEEEEEMKMEEMTKEREEKWEEKLEEEMKRTPCIRRAALLCPTRTHTHTQCSSVIYVFSSAPGASCQDQS